MLLKLNECGRRIMKSFYTPNDFKHLATDAEMIQAAVDAAAAR